MSNTENNSSWCDGCTPENCCGCAEVDPPLATDSVEQQERKTTPTIGEDARLELRRLAEQAAWAGVDPQALREGREIRQPACWCETCDIAANSGLRSRMSLCPQCGDKRCPCAQQHDNPCRVRGGAQGKGNG